ncbi:PQQ-binding-like beta-propeller repeat protein [Candidatus Nephthysia bennettiae]|uniref:PQQ-binding-like beta-propeller repeat protein n=1 Tax=Candidatus Nephthysia bennettiae TaxID=3127016 RepID=A0A934K9T7_9BACT|nr:PQQ-binding-like beta-propeller repeat protein [Candidatus Dormibacteraeota bacterium]MBJ7613850.1 PQQ-binding-like beta-propeller repeat protein [Candidatus Dormibacteraeota bacterium]
MRVLRMAAAVLLLAAPVWAPPAAASSAPHVTPSVRASSGTAWTTYHANNQRTGNDPAAPSFAGTTGPLAQWSAGLDGKVYAEPLALGRLIFVATENDTVYALDEDTGSARWSRHLGTPAVRSQVAGGCGNIDPIGITGTPVIDPTGGVLYAAGLIGSPFKYQLWAVRISDGALLSTRDLTPPGLNPAFQQERGALALGNRTVYVPFGGWAGDCTPYHPWVLGVPTAGGNLLTYQPQTGGQQGGGIWAPSGEALDSAGNLYLETGNGFSSPSSPCPTTYGQWDHGDGVLKLSPSLVEQSFFAPSNWCRLNGTDQDLGSVAPLLLPDGTLFASGKSGQGWLLSSSSLGGFNSPLFGAQVDSCHTSSSVFGGFAYAAPFVFVPCDGVGLVALRVDSANHRFSAGWSAGGFSPGPPIVAGGLVWSVSRNGGRLAGFDQATGQIKVQVSVGSASRFVTPTSADGWIVVPTDAGVEAFQFGVSPSLTSGWQTVGGTLASAPDSATWGGGHVDVFARGTDAGLWTNSRDGGRWSGWAPLGGIVQSGSGPGAVSWGPGRLDVFVRGSDDALWHRWYDGGSWSGWESLGGVLTSGPDAASWTAGRLDVFVRGTDSGLWHRWFDGGSWSGWEPLGGSLNSDPSATSWGPGRLDVFARSPNNQLIHRWWSGAWGSETLPLAVSSGPDAASPGPGLLDVFGLGTASAVWGTAFTGSGWTAWHALGGTGTSDPSAASPSPGTFDLFVRGTDQSMYQATGR